MPGGAEAPPFDLVVTDCKLRGMGGAHLARRIRADARLALLLLIVLSSPAEKSGIAEHGGIPADEWLLKPIRSRRLKGAIGRVLVEARRR